jgi:SPP1 gp7 family putative phage head morphogenesis protein
MDSKILLSAFDLKPAAAIKYLRNKGLKISGSWYEIWQEAHTQSFTVANCMNLDVLQDIRSMVDKALDEGITFQQFKKQLMPKLKKKGWWGKEETVDEATGKTRSIQLGSVRRLQTIYQTNNQVAYMAGRYKSMMSSARALPYWQYIAVMDSRTRPEHRALNGKVFRYDDPIWKKLYPPNRWGCRCRIRALTGGQVQRMGLTVSNSDGMLVTKEVPIGTPESGKLATVTGFKTTNDEGQPIVTWTDPGWDYNPGESAFRPDLSLYDKKLAQQFLKAKKNGR